METVVKDIKKEVMKLKDTKKAKKDVSPADNKKAKGSRTSVNCCHSLKGNGVRVKVRVKPMGVSLKEIVPSAAFGDTG